jgi:type 1 glutamine amidotransferase
MTTGFVGNFPERAEKSHPDWALRGAGMCARHRHIIEMKAQIPAILTAAAALFVVAKNPSTEQPPAGAAGKIAAVLPEKPYASPQKPRKLLVFSKTNGFRHASIATGKLLLAELGRKTGAFEVVISDDLAQFEKDSLAGYDAVCFLSTTQNVFLPHPNELAKLSDDEKQVAAMNEARFKENLMNFIKNGGGFVGIHAATDTCYEWAEFGRMINGFFDGHPWGAGTMVSVKVEPGQEKHPLVAMFEGRNVEFKEEIYQLKDPYDSKAVTMLLRLDTEKTDMTVNGIKRKDGDFGIAWARNWDKGRVFYSSLGHNHEIYWHPEVVRHYLAGIQWALGDLKAEVK